MILTQSQRATDTVFDEKYTIDCTVCDLTKTKKHEHFGGMSHKLSAKQIDQICRRYVAGESTRELATVYEVSHKTIGDWLRKRGVPRRHVGASARVLREGVKFCSLCRQEKPATTEFFNRHRCHKDGLTARCKECEKVIHEMYYDENKEQINEKHRNLYSEYKHTKKYAYLGSPRTLAARRMRNNESRRTLRLEMIDAYGGCCSCCGEIYEAFLTLEHTNHDGKAHRKEVGQGEVYRDLKHRGWPQEGFTLLCWNCQMATRFGGACPHVLYKELAGGARKKKAR